MNDVHTLTSENIRNALPQVLQNDSSINALAEATAEVLSQHNSDLQLIAIYANIDKLPSDLLDILAYDFKIDWWETGLDVDIKRQLLKTNWNVHRILGTPTAVKTVLKLLYSNDVEVLEWWQYGGTPGTFRIKTDSFQLVGNLNRLLRILQTVKRLSAHLEKVEVHSSLSHTVGTAIVVAAQVSTTLQMNEEPVEQLYSWYTDEAGNPFCDECGNIFIEEVTA